MFARQTNLVNVLAKPDPCISDGAIEGLVRIQDNSGQCAAASLQGLTRCGLQSFHARSLVLSARHTRIHDSEPSRAFQALTALISSACEYRESRRRRRPTPLEGSKSPWPDAVHASASKAVPLATAAASTEVETVLWQYAAETPMSSSFWLVVVSLPGTLNMPPKREPHWSLQVFGS